MVGRLNTCSGWPRRCRLGLVSFLFILTCAPAAYSDRVILTNGDILTGKVSSLAAGKLQFISEPLGALTIDIAKINSIQTDAELPVLLTDHEQLIQARLAPAQGGVYLDHTEPKLLVKFDSIFALGSDALKIISGPDKSFKWSGNFDVGLAGRSGNAERIATNGTMKLTLANPDWVFNTYLSAIYAEQTINSETQRTDNEIKGGIRVQRMISDALSTFVRVDLERDEIEQLDLRGNLAGGVGLLWFKNEKWFYENRLEIGYQQEEFDNGETSRSTIGGLTSDLRYQVNSHIQLTQETSWLPDLDDIDSYRITSESAATIYLDNSHHLFIKSGFKQDYDNQPVENVERLDMYYFTNLGYGF